MISSEAFLIVVGIDGSDQSMAALRWAITEARLRHGQVRLITVWNYPPMAATIEDGVLDDSFKQAAEQVQADALKTVADDGVDVTGQVVQDYSPAGALLDAAKNADLLIVGSRGHGGFASLLLGSVSTQVAHHASCPVLIVRPKPSGPAQQERNSALVAQAR